MCLVILDLLFHLQLDVLMLDGCRKIVDDLFPCISGQTFSILLPVAIQSLWWLLFAMSFEIQDTWLDFLCCPNPILGESLPSDWQWCLVLPVNLVP